MICLCLVDALINAEVLLPQGEESEGFDEGSNLLKAKAIWNFADEDGNIIGNANVQPELNTMMYEVEFPDGEVRPYAANMIAKYIWSQVDTDGQRYIVFESIIDHHIDSTIAVSKANMYIRVNGRRAKIYSRS